MKSYEFELHNTNEPNQIITIESDSLITAYNKAVEQYPDVLAVVSTNPTIDLYDENMEDETMTNKLNETKIKLNEMLQYYRENGQFTIESVEELLDLADYLPLAIQEPINKLHYIVTQITDNGGIPMLKLTLELIESELQIIEVVNYIQTNDTNSDIQDFYHETTTGESSRDSLIECLQRILSEWFDSNNNLSERELGMLEWVNKVTVITQ